MNITLVSLCVYVFPLCVFSYPEHHVGVFPRRDVVVADFCLTKISNPLSMAVAFQRHKCVGDWCLVISLAACVGMLLECFSRRCAGTLLG